MVQTTRFPRRAAVSRCSLRHRTRPVAAFTGARGAFSSGSDAARVGYDAGEIEGAFARACRMPSRAYIKRLSMLLQSDSGCFDRRGGNGCERERGGVPMKMHLVTPRHQWRASPLSCVKASTCLLSSLFTSRVCLDTTTDPKGKLPRLNNAHDLLPCGSCI